MLGSAPPCPFRALASPRYDQAMTTNKLTTAQKRAIISAIRTGRCIDEGAPDQLASYINPERGLPGETDLVLLPETKGEVRDILLAANEVAAPLVLSAGRTGLVEAQRPMGEAVLSLERLKRFMRITIGEVAIEFGGTSDLEKVSKKIASHIYSEKVSPESTVSLTVETGVTVDNVNKFLEPIGRMWPLEMGSTSSATVGACVANASAGANAVCYGTAVNMASEVSGFRATGEPVSQSIDCTPHKPPLEGLALDSTKFPFDKHLAGSQGSLGIITELTLRTFPIPTQREGVFIALRELPAALSLLQSLHKSFPGDLEEFEYISKESLDAAKRFHPHFQNPFQSDEQLEAPAFLLVQVKSQKESEELLEELAECILEVGISEDDVSLAPLKVLKSLRHSLTESSNLFVNSVKADKNSPTEAHRIAFDVAVPVEKSPEFLLELQLKLAAQEPSIYVNVFGHMGMGGFHVHLIERSGEPLSTERKKVLTSLVLEIIGPEGTYSAEHGVGTKWAETFLSRTSEARLQQVAQWFREADPRGILNPRAFGKSRLLALK